MGILEQSAVPVNAAIVPGGELLRREWLAERIGDMGISWGTADSRVAGTLWWCMAASSLVTPIVAAYADGRPAMSPALDRIACEIRPDGGVERVLSIPTVSEDQSATGAGDRCRCATAFPASRTVPGNASPDAVDRDIADLDTAAAGGTARDGAPGEPWSATPTGPALRTTLSRLIPLVAEVSGASPAALWAIVADAIGNRALDIGAHEAGARLAREVAGRLPVPRFTDIGSRTFVRRISCCLVFEVPGCEMCTSCPKRPAAQRAALLSELAARG
ncbi:(2Fe-2S)-binding protein [Nocardia otitidiscaviarum]|uniref:(2Fe-2S)-binding protein n=1 Tax=Nocardia otitidiscaviarum TaxID=1823 RepID=UPI0004A6F026|nr:(2Fe-2S)-binding protein [Nocardia otitidiscaviarum]MBF6135214.1 (2Fe-2S)-binding protein [Nocardia otitidiscaviarum]MBF6487035.1 (2Fe-2S)-binding protein [Nocardia otitidiscaviarum]